MTQGNGTVIIVEYSEDMETQAGRLGVAFELEGHKVVYRRVRGWQVLRFRVNGHSFDWTQLEIMVRHVLTRRA